MKKIFAIFSAALLLAACNDDFLDKKPLDKLSEDAVFNSDKLAESFVNGFYVVLPDPYQEGNVSCITDEGFFRYGGTSTRYILDGSLNADNVMPIAEGGYAHDTRTTTLNIWNRSYEFVYRMNSFIAQVTKPDNKLSTDCRNRLLGETYFLRAWAYYNMIQRYGGVPYITKVYSINEEYNAKREDFDVCVDKILADLDQAEQLVPTKEAATKGRINKDIVMALRARLLLVAASPLFNDPENPEGGMIRGQYSKDKWKKAFDANKAVVDRADNEGAYTMESTYDGYWMNSDTKENIWSKFFISNASSGNAKKAQVIYSVVYFNGWTSCEPTMALINDYEMKNGKKFFEAGSGYDPKHPFKNRDPRLYKTVALPFTYYQHTDQGVWYNEIPQGQYFSSNDSRIQYRESDGSPSYELKTYLLYEGVDPASLTKGSAFPDFSKKAKHQWDASSFSGFELNKWYIPNQPITESQVVTILYPWFRLPEFYLNLAECAYMLGDENTCRTYINKVRARADVNMPPVTESGTSLWDRYVNERRIEFAFEFMRYFDVRRWKTAPFYENVPMAGIRTMVFDKNSDGTPDDTLYTVTRVYNESENNTSYYWPNFYPQGSTPDKGPSNTYKYSGRSDGLLPQAFIERAKPQPAKSGDPLAYIIRYTWLGKDYEIDYGDCTLNFSPTPKFFPVLADGTYPNYLMPIPHSEINKAKGTIVQNPGY